MAFPQPSDFDPVGIPVGQIYTNPSTKTKYEWLGTHWSVYHPPGSPEASKEFAVSTPSSDEPQEPNDGDFWYDTTDDNLQVRYNEEWIPAAMNKEQSQTLDDLKDSLYCPEFISGEEEAIFPEFSRTSSYGNLQRSSSDGFWPLQSDGSRYSKSSTSSTCYGFEFYYFTNNYWKPDPKEYYDELDSFNKNLSDGLIEGYIEYQRSGRNDTYVYKPQVKSISRSGNSVFVMFYGSTNIGSNDYLYDFTFGVRRSTPSRQILKHNATIGNATTDLVVKINAYPKADDANVSGLTTNYCYKLDSNNSVIDYSTSSNRIFIPDGNFKSNYYWDDEYKRTISRSLMRPSGIIEINSKLCKPGNISWITTTVNNKPVDGIVLVLEGSIGYSKISCDITFEIAYTKAVSAANGIVYDTIEDHNKLMDFAS